ncbi:PREDICTED: WD repeat domain phosphoinositide-interacting protein 2-like [Thamnophis sirtalis]|uniref:WD repeat domain phosphoinositide-interacting protein 2-like n=1 Tax=Thamnophis sirtalis TaxID=35019 RepID=A0A6I9YJU8_9SAUR|nr:PREDICTED: WD repeat domain phosphoinositide-interacting protein 2-like [Thamnophis sirtalis]
MLEQYLCCFVNQQQNDWADYLAVVEFAFNNSQHTSTQPYDNEEPSEYKVASIREFPMAEATVPIPDSMCYGLEDFTWENVTFVHFIIILPITFKKRLTQLVVLSLFRATPFPFHPRPADDTEDVCIVERLFSSSLVAIVSLRAPRKLKVCHFKKGTEICNYSYSNTILAVKLNRQRLIVCLEESLYIHNIRDMKVLHTIRETPPNPAGLCSLSINNDNCYLAYPGSASIGEVQVFDTINLRATNMIPAHDSPLAALAFDASGTKLATASEKGTVIRVFSIPEGQKLFEFRRGMKR